MPVDMANHIMVAVMSPWLTMYARPTDAPWIAAKTAESFGLNWNPTRFSPPASHSSFSHNSNPDLTRFLRTSSGLMYSTP